MMDVEDVPLPLGILDMIVPEMRDVMIEKVKNGDRSSVYVNTMMANLVNLVKIILRNQIDY